MDLQIFIENFRTAFGNYELPVAFWYSETPATTVEKTKHCFISKLKEARENGIVSFDGEAFSCPGAKVYCGYTEMPAFIPGFVSGKEHYKKTPEQVSDFVSGLQIELQTNKYLNFASISRIDSLDGLEGLLFFATPDVLSGLVSWIQYDNDRPDAVSVPFGSGCSSLVSQTVKENRLKGYRTFLGMFDPSARPQVESSILSLAIPMSRFGILYQSMMESCLVGVHAWNKVKARIEST